MNIITLRFALKRMTQQWRVLLVLLIVMCLVTAFFALGPLYLDYTNEVALRFAIDEELAGETQVLIASDVPFSDEDLATVERNLGPVVNEMRRFMRSLYAAETPTLCNYALDHCNQLFAFDPFIENLITVVEGRLPDPSPPPQTEDDFHVPVIEAVISAEVAEEMELAVGDTYESQGIALVPMEIVGIIEINDPDDRFWMGNRLLTSGAWIQRDFGEDRYDWGLMIHPRSHQHWVDRVTEGTSHLLYLDTDGASITAANAQQTLDAFGRAINQIQGEREFPLRVSGELLRVLEHQETLLSEGKETITFLSGLLLVLMLFSLSTVVHFTVQARQVEWLMLRSRGSGLWQLALVQLVQATALAAVAVFVGIYLSKIMLLVVGLLNPYTEHRPDIVRRLEISRTSILFSLTAAGLAVLVMVMPVLRVVRLQVAEQRQARARKLRLPRWATYYLDVVFLLLGSAFVMRIYWAIGGSLSDFLHPRQMMERLVTEGSDLTDAFSLAAPALLIGGGALLWLRIFPRLMSGVAALVRRQRGLSGPLAVWTVERNTSHYGQFVLLLIVTLAVGVASLGLQRTHREGAWQVARDETGGTARYAVADHHDLERRPWETLPGVETSADVMLQYVRANQVSTIEPMRFIALYPEQFQSHFAVEALDTLEELAPRGQVLPTNAQTLTVQARSAAGYAVALNAHLYDKRGFRFTVPLEPTGEADGWATLSGDLSAHGQPPLYLWRVGMTTPLQEDTYSLQDTAYLHSWATLDAEGVATSLPEGEWAPLLAEEPFVGPWNLDYTYFKPPEAVEPPTWTELDGQRVLQVDYMIQLPIGTYRPTEPGMTVDWSFMEPLPIVVSPEFTRIFRAPFNVPPDPTIPLLQVGDERRISISLGTSGNLFTTVRIVAIIDDFPTMNTLQDNLFMIVPLPTARFLINQHQTAEERLVDVNQVWLDLADPEPAANPELRALNGETTFAWIRYNDLLNRPLSTTLAGILFVGFWISLILILINFVFYIAITAEERAVSFGILRAIGWNINNIWRLLLIEQGILALPAFLIGGALGLGLAYLFLPFMALPGDVTLLVPHAQVIAVMGSLVVGFVLLLVGIGLWLRRRSVHQVLRLGGE